MVSPGRGVKINYIFYWCDGMDDPKIQGQQIPVRFDPFDLGLHMHSSLAGGFNAARTTTGPFRAGRRRNCWSRRRSYTHKIGSAATVSDHGQQTGAGLQSINLQESLLLQRLRTSRDPGSEKPNDAC